MDRKNQKKSSNIIEKKSSKKDKKIDITNDIVINFKYDDYEPVINKYKPSYRKSSGVMYYDNIDILDQSRFRFILKLKDGSNNYTKYANQVNTNLHWEDILAVVYYSAEIYNCAICLEKKLVCPMITRCGHIFCWPCIFNYHDYWTKSSINKKVPKCPLCQEKVHMYQLKFCEILNCMNYSASNGNSSDYSTHYATFNLIMRDRKAPTLYNIFYDPDLEYYKKTLLKDTKDTFSFLPFEDQEEFGFSRVFLTTPSLVMKRYINVRAELEAGLKDEVSEYNDERKVACITKLLDFMNVKVQELKEKNVDLKTEDSDNEAEFPENEESKSAEEVTSDVIAENQSTIDDELTKTNSTNALDLKKFVYFFQEQFGDIYYLHPINYSILLAEYVNEESLPAVISGRILEIEMHQVTPQIKNQYKFLSHLKIGSLFFFIEIDLKQNVSNHTLKTFHNLLKDRAKIRNSIKREEDHYDNYVKDL